MLIKKFMFLMLVLLSIVVIAVGQQETKESKKVVKAKLDSQEKKCSYAAGYDFGINFIKRYDKIDMQTLILGLEDAIKENEPLMNEDERLDALIILGKQMKEKIEKEMKALSKKNIEEGKKFLEENAKKEGIITTSSGLQYKIIKEGTGLQPTMEDKVFVHYKGMHLDGRIFDETYSKNAPSEFFMERLIAGWQEALKLMREGAIWEIYLKPELAYGEKGFAAAVGPNETVIFQIELVKVMKWK